MVMDFLQHLSYICLNKQDESDEYHLQYFYMNFFHLFHSDLYATRFGECYTENLAPTIVFRGSEGSSFFFLSYFTKYKKKLSADSFLSGMRRVFFLFSTNFLLFHSDICYTENQAPTIFFRRSEGSSFFSLSYYTKYEREPSADSFLSGIRRVFFLFLQILQLKIFLTFKNDIF